MAAHATSTPYKLVLLDEFEAAGAPTDGRVRLDVRRQLGINAFGVNAFRADADGRIVPEHSETQLGAAGAEELYVVLKGSALFEVDGERVEAGEGAFVFVEPAARRSAVATQPGTTILAVGATPGQGYEPAPPEAAEAFAAYNEGNYEEALAKQQRVLEQRPNSVLALFNAACFEARLGRADDAFAHLRRALEADSRVIENIRTDEDLDTLREDPRFAELLAAAPE